MQQISSIFDCCFSRRNNPNRYGLDPIEQRKLMNKYKKDDGDESDGKAAKTQTNEYGDDEELLKWDGPEDSDEEIEELLPFKCDYEIKKGIRFSKNGIIKFVEEEMVKE